MNYSENKSYGRKHVRTDRENLFKRRLIMSWVICFMIGLLIGSLITVGTIKWHDDNNPSTYGTIDGRVFTDEISMDWSSGAELGFVPLDVPMDEEMQEFIYCLSYGYNIEFPFVMALINEESSFRSDVISETNDYGLMQINEINHEWLTETIGVTNYLDPYENVRSGLFILRTLFEKYEDPEKVLIAYSMGETGAAILWKEKVFETNYSNRIMKTAAEYKEQIEEKEGETND